MLAGGVCDAGDAHTRAGTTGHSNMRRHRADRYRRRYSHSYTQDLLHSSPIKATQAQRLQAASSCIKYE